ncbi:hypothetical protein TPY_0063 [Sulfobacillus acidophilus TPY]|uniref:Uncharacterized protein n=1 Tax=Sulfobacillus acidophilus (strain ATCC 700253 / DSM 10332 / NAL) TaxID=679936 RepID=G8TV50_SULAD|nr:hypothetical protein TPY_0063 [Sulfobacillus acidophilus TPY]AEW03631.1 hypothetical protein Sulac_0057 [Sulfobacillus acidophilus DSM 10332]
MTGDAERLAEYMERTLPLRDLRLGNEYRYAHLGLALVDAVFSVGIKYTTTSRVVARYARYQRLTLFRPNETEWPSVKDQEPLDALVALGERLGPQRLADEVFQNRNRTSSSGGILKAEAVIQAARVFTDHGVRYFQDLPKAAANSAVEAAFRAIPGQASGVSWAYFWMLAGDDNLIKPDRHVLTYLETALGGPIGLERALAVIRGAAALLQPDYPAVTPRRLDYAIWNYQRTQGR